MGKVKCDTCLKLLLYVFLVTVASSCGRETCGGKCMGSSEYAQYFSLTDTSVFILSPHDDGVCEFPVKTQVRRIVCMSSSHVACLSFIGADSLIKGVSGLGYITDTLLHREACADVGYEGNIDYESIARLDPDVVTAYAVGRTEPQYVSKLRSIGVPVLVLYDHLESHPLARAEYVRLFGTLAGCRHVADSLFKTVSRRYQELLQTVETREGQTVKSVLFNIPYGDAWYVPGADSYMARLVHDAGGRILGAGKGSSSSVISMEEAYRLSRNADIWLNPGHCRTREQLSAVHQLFPSFGPLAGSRPVYNNLRRTNSAGGNDFYESGTVRPDLILEDLIRIFSAGPDSLTYFIKM